MKNSMKILGTLALLAGAGYLLYRGYKKELKKLEKEENIEKEKLDQLGISKEKIEEEMVPGDNNLVKALYTGIEFSDKWDIDYVDIDGCLENENVIHVGISDTPNGKQQDFAFMLEIPEIDEGNYKSPKIRDYISKFSEAAKHLWYDIVNMSDRNSAGRRPITRLVGYFVVSYKKEGETEERFKFVKIPEDLHKPYAHGEHDGLTEYVAALRGGKEKFGKVDIELVDEDGDPIKMAKAIDVQLFFKIIIPIQRNDIGCNRPGINLETGLKCLKHLTEIEIVKDIDDTGKYSVTYDHIMFHAQDEKTGKWSLFKYYTTTIDKETNKRRVIIRDYTY